jgi:CheY-like chemotaxis protein/anti-sigma regulatory factor (Ser/Thr protein kinase)
LLGPLEQLRTAARDRLTGEEREQIGRMTRNVHRLRRLINQVLDLAELDAGQLSLEARPLNLRDEVARIARAFQPLAERQQIDLRVDTASSREASAEPPVVADPESLEHILGNLLSNALKFTPAGGEVTVRAQRTETAGVISVADTGPGIPPEKQAAVFDRFQQAQRPRGRTSPHAHEEGTGIGLALAHQLVDLHGGTIELESAVGEGTTFTVRLPRGRDHLSEEHLSDRVADSGDARVEQRDAPPAGSAPRPSGIENDVASNRTAETEEDSEPAPEADAPDRTTVLVVEDNTDMRQYVRSVLAPDFRVLTAANGADGLAAARDALPDCILADVMMPEMDGIALTERLRTDDRTAAIPVLLLTARAGPDAEVEGLSAGATDYVTKPFAPQVLQMRVRGTLAYQKRLRRRLLQELQEAPDDTDAPADAPTDAPVSGAPASEAPAASEPAPFEAAMRAAIARHLPDPDFDPDALADALAVSRSTLYRRARRADAPSPAHLIRTMRLERGAELLAEGAGTVSEVAYAVGFNSLAHFSRKFTNHFDQAPTEYVADADGR